jgi:mannose-6-phosphate isomerase-like protein (cupin superfamily)
MFTALEAGTRPIIVPAGEGTVHTVLGDTLRFALTSDDTGGALALGFAEVQPNSGPPPHLHLNEDEIFIVLEGRMAFMADGEWTEGGPGTVAYLPRAVPHCFRNIGNSVARFCAVSTPGGFERFYAQWELAMSQGPDFQRLHATAAAHGIELIR